jgi:hypothetical protein
MTYLKKLLIGTFSIFAFALLMMINVTTTETGIEFSMCGQTLLANDGECNDPEEEEEFYYNNSNPWDARNCRLDGEGCLTCTTTPIED